MNRIEVNCKTGKISTVPLTLEEEAALNDPAAVAARTAQAAEAARLSAIDDAIRVDSVIAQLKAMSNAQFDTWWSANVTNAAQAISVLRRLALVVVRRVL